MKINLLAQNISTNPYKNKFTPTANIFKAGSPLAFRGKDDGDSFSKSEQDEYLSDLEASIKQINKLRADFFSGKLYQTMLVYNPDMAFLYNPNLNAKEKSALEGKSESIFTQPSLAKKLGLHPAKIAAWKENGNLKFKEVPSISKNNHYFFNTTSYINIDTETNKRFIKYIESILPHSIPGEILISDYNFSQSEIPKLVKAGQLKPAGFDGIPEKYCGPFNLLFDMEDETNKATFERHLRTTPIPSKNYGENGKTSLVPVGYLQKLGYGDIKTLANMVKTGKLPGKMVQCAPGQYKVYVDVSAQNVKPQLKHMRYKNPDIRSIEGFAKEAGITKTAVRQAIEDDEIEIIPEYIFNEDYKERLLSRQNPKNQAFLDKTLFENQLIENQRAERRAQVRKERIARIQNPIESLRRTLVWSMCPYTKMIASETAKQDGNTTRILSKISEFGIESLSPIEDRKHRAYCKSFWQMAGTEEYSKAHKQARVIIDQFKQGGIEAVEDPEARKIIEDFLEEFKDVWTPDN